MKKYILIAFGMLFAFQFVAVAKDKYVPPPVPNHGNFAKRIHEEEKKCDEISPRKDKKDKKDEHGNHFGHDKDDNKDNKGKKK